MSAFSGLFIGSSAVHAAQRGINVTGQNIANAATPGYSRQRVDLESIGGPGVPAFWSKYDGTGEGVKVTGVSRMTDEFLVARARQANAGLGSLEEQVKTLAALERTVDEPSDTGLQKQLQEFWNSWGKVASDPKGDAPKNLVFENANKVANQLNRMAQATQTQFEDSVAEMDALVIDVNTMARDVARLNEAIRNNNIAKVPSNELLDQRDLLISRISELTGAVARPAEADRNAPFNSQSVDVWIGGEKLVDSIEANELQLEPPGEGALATERDQVSVTLGGADVVTGRLGGLLQSVNETIPKYAAQFDAIATQLAEVVNEQQTKGYAFTMAGDTVGTSAPGTALFEGSTALTLRVVDGFTARDLATSAGDPRGTPAALDGDNALAMSRHLMSPTGPDASYRALVVGLGVETQSANRNSEVQRNVVMRAEDARDNVSGVSLNEEMTNLIQFQHSFSAAAKFISVIDQTIETLINMKR